MAILVDDSAETVLPIYVEAFDLIGFDRLGPAPQGRGGSRRCQRPVASSTTLRAHHLLEPEHVIGPVSVLRIARRGPVIMGVRVARVEELHDREAAPVHIEMDVPLLEVGRKGGPHPRVRVPRLDSTPRLQPCPLALLVAVHEEEIQRVQLGVLVDGDNHAADRTILPGHVQDLGARRAQCLPHVLVRGDRLVQVDTELVHGGIGERALKSPREVGVLVRPRLNLRGAKTRPNLSDLRLRLPRVRTR